MHTVWGFGVAICLRFQLAWPNLVLLLLSALSGLLRRICNAKQLLLWAPDVCLEMTPSPRFSQVLRCVLFQIDIFLYLR